MEIAAYITLYEIAILIEKHYCRTHPRPFWPLGQRPCVQSLQFFMLINLVRVDF